MRLIECFCLGHIYPPLCPWVRSGVLECPCWLCGCPGLIEFKGPPLPGLHSPAWHPHDFFGLFFCCIFGTACCSPKNDIVWPWDSELEALGFHWVPLWDVFFATSSDRVIFWESCSRAGESSQNKVPGSSELHETLIKSDLAGGPVLGHTFFEQRCQHGWPLMISYRFWGPPGEPTGGPTNHVFRFWKHCWDQMAPILT